VNNVAHSDLSWFRLLLECNSTTSSRMILKMNMCYKGGVECLRSSHGEGQRSFYRPPRGPLHLAGWWFI
jgi:hypothetical protein